MKKISFVLTFILSVCIIPYSEVNSQILISANIDNLFNIEVSQLSDRYSMRLDFMTESQVDNIIQLRKVKLDDLCQKTMGCKSRTNVVLAVGDKIQLFNDDRISSIELIKVNSGKKTTIARSITTEKESYIEVPQEITRENIETYFLQIL